MSNVQFAINAESVKNMQTVHGQFLLGNLLAKIGLAFPEVDGKRNRKNIGAGKLATKDNHNESILNLKKDALLEFTFEVIAPITYTSFKHELLAKQNESAQEFSDKMKIFANMGTIELERDSFLGESLDSTKIHALIKTFVSQSKQVTRISQNWRKNKGAYMVKRNGEFVPYTLPVQALSPVTAAAAKLHNATQNGNEESVNLAAAELRKASKKESVKA